MEDHPSLKASSFNFPSKLPQQRFPMITATMIVSESPLTLRVILSAPTHSLAKAKLCPHVLWQQQGNHISITGDFFLQFTQWREEMRNEVASGWRSKGSILKHEFLRRFHFQSCGVSCTQAETSIPLMDLWGSTEAQN